MGLVIDTSAAVAVERAAAHWPQLLDAYTQEPVALPAIVYAELLVGVALADTSKRGRQRRRGIAALAATAEIVDFGPAIAERWAALFADLTRQGRVIPSNDPRLFTMA